MLKKKVIAVRKFIPLRSRDVTLKQIPLGFRSYQTRLVDDIAGVAEAIEALGIAAWPAEPGIDWDDKIFSAYLVQRDRIGIKPGAKSGEMMAAMLGERSRRTELAQVLLTEWKNWCEQPEQLRPRERIARCRVHPTSTALIPFALFLNEAINKLVKEDVPDGARHPRPVYKAVGVGDVAPPLETTVDSDRPPKWVPNLRNTDEMERVYYTARQRGFPRDVAKIEALVGHRVNQSFTIDVQPEIIFMDTVVSQCARSALEQEGLLWPEMDREICHAARLLHEARGKLGARRLLFPIPSDNQLSECLQYLTVKFPQMVANEHAVYEVRFIGDD